MGAWEPWWFWECGFSELPMQIIMASSRAELARKLDNANFLLFFYRHLMLFKCISNQLVVQVQQ